MNKNNNIKYNTIKINKKINLKIFCCTEFAFRKGVCPKRICSQGDFIFCFMSRLPLTLSLSQAKIIGFWKQHRSR